MKKVIKVIPITFCEFAPQGSMRFIPGPDTRACIQYGKAMEMDQL